MGKGRPVVALSSGERDGTDRGDRTRGGRGCDQLELESAKKTPTTPERRVG